MPAPKTDNPGDWTSSRLLIVDDDVELCELVGQYLNSQGFQIDAVHDGTMGVERRSTATTALIILDVMLPGIRGFEVLRQIRAKSAVPIVMLTAHGDDVDRIVGLEIGADDYLPKPFNPRELAARIHAVLRRTAAGPARDLPALHRFFWTTSDWTPALGPPATIHATWNSPPRSSSCSPCFSSPRAKWSRATIWLKSPWAAILEPSDRSLDVHVSNLRKKLGPCPDGTERIRAIRNVGYVYVVSRILA